MAYPALTACYGSLLGILFVCLSIWVSMGRAKYHVYQGDGGQAALLKRIRTQGNFAEYVPLALLLIGLCEARGTDIGIVRGLLVILLIARIAHPFGMTAPDKSLRQSALRAPAMVATWLVLLASSIMLLLF
jgi:hypothetical protein